jgi:hypothetical protein
MFRIFRLELDDDGNVIERQALQPPYELWEDATALYCEVICDPCGQFRPPSIGFASFRRLSMSVRDY